MQILSGLFEQLETHGWGTCEEALPADLLEELSRDCQKSWQSGAFHDAHIGRGSEKSRVTEIRGDSICWLEDHRFMTWAAELRKALNERYFLGLRREEFHFARYPAGKGYQKHMDQHRDQTDRRVSLVLYLNPDWSEKDGGQLRLFSADDANLEVATITPQWGRLVLFRSDMIPHEVLPCFPIRWSLTGWFRTDF